MNGRWATITTARGEIEARVLVTQRMKSLRVKGRTRPHHRPPLPLELRRARAWRSGERAHPVRRRPERLDPGVEGAHREHPRRPTLPRAPLRHRRARAPATRAAEGAAPPGFAGDPDGASPPTDGAEEVAMQRMGFFTDTTLCIGCKACEVACKQWNQLPDDGFRFTGMSYDNTGMLGASTLAPRLLRRAPRGAARPGEPARRRRGRPARVRRAVPGRPAGADQPARPRHPADPHRDAGRARAHRARALEVLLADALRRLQALRARRLPRGLPHRRDRPHRVRLGLRAAGRLQRLRVLRLGLPVRRRRPARGRRPRLEVHPLLRPAEGRDGPRVREGLPDGVDPVRPARRPAGAGPPARRAASRTRRRRGLPVRRGRGEPARHRGAARVLPPVRPTRGLQPAARSGGAHRQDRAVLGARWPRACSRSRRSRWARCSPRGGRDGPDGSAEAGDGAPRRAERGSRRWGASPARARRSARRRPARRPRSRARSGWRQSAKPVPRRGKGRAITGCRC